MADGVTVTAPSPRLDEAMDFIMENVDGYIEIPELEKMAKSAGISGETLKNARAALRKEGRIKIKQNGFGKDKKWILYTINKTENTER